jgi:OFA family oxalate/formate antiporter-like MFS transporter
MNSSRGVEPSTDAQPRSDGEAIASGSSRRAVVQLIAGVVCMAMVANLQYGWTIFINPIDAQHHWGKAAIQVAFTLFVLFETWLVPFEAYLADRIGPRPVVMFGALLVAASWIIYSKATTLSALYAGGIVGGIGTGFVYGTCIGNVVKWFEKRRGLAAGFTAAGFGAGAAITILPLTRSLAERGYQATFFEFALIQGAVVLIAALLLQRPPSKGAARTANPRLLQTKQDSTPLQTLASPVFWVMYLAFVCAAASGLMATAQLAPIANSFGIAKDPMKVFGLVIPALTFALSLNNLVNGLSRPLFGWISDWLGREYTMCVSFLLGGIASLGLARFGSTSLGFVLMAALLFFAYGDIYSVFPALSSDHFGRRYASTNYGLLYTAKGAAALFVPIGSILAARTGSWWSTLVAAAIGNFAASGIMLLIPRLRLRELRRQDQRLDRLGVLEPKIRSETSSA